MFSCDKYSPHSSLSLCLNIWLLSRKLLHSIFKIVWLVNTFDTNFFMLTHDPMQHLKVPKRTSTIDAKFLSFVLDFQLFLIWISIFGFAYAVRKLRIIFFFDVCVSIFKNLSVVLTTTKISVLYLLSSLCVYKYYE